jgi:hypothetical protein
LSTVSFFSFTAVVCRYYGIYLFDYPKGSGRTIGYRWNVSIGGQMQGEHGEGHEGNGERMTECGDGKRGYTEREVEHKMGSTEKVGTEDTRVVTSHPQSSHVTPPE